jgi:hypothetical protein
MLSFTNFYTRYDNEKILFAALVIGVLPSMSVADQHMRNTNPNPVTGPHHMQNKNPSPDLESKEEAPLTKHMQNTNPKPSVESNEEPTLTHHMQNRNPKC